jgi:hypothetical protein
MENERTKSSSRAAAAEQNIKEFIWSRWRRADYYSLRVNSAVGYIAPNDMLAGVSGRDPRRMLQWRP